MKTDGERTPRNEHSRGAALVTGAVGGPGTAIVRRLLEDKLSIVACDRRAGEREAWLASFREEERGNIHFYALDVTAEEQADALRDALDRGSPPYRISDDAEYITGQTLHLNGGLYLPG